VTMHLDAGDRETSCGTMWGPQSATGDVDKVDCRRCLREALKAALADCRYLDECR